MSLLTNNAIGWANVQIAGGWTRIAWVCGLIAVVLPVAMFGTTRIDETRTASALLGWYGVMGALQAVLLLIIMPSRVHGAIKRDRIGKVIESHRLMPTPAWHAIFGYILGPNLMLLAACGTVFIIGLFVAGPAEQDWRGWIATHAAALGLSATMCCLVAFSTQWMPKLNPALLALFLGPMFAAVGVSILPPMRVMFAPYLTGFAAMQTGELDLGHLVSFVSQVLLSAILFVGACRRYRRDDVPALGFFWGFALLGLWVALTWAGMYPERGRSRLPLNPREVLGLSYVISITTSMLLAMAPIASAATANLAWRARKRIDPYFEDRRPIPPALATLLVALLVGLLLVPHPDDVGSLTSRYASGSPAQVEHVALTGGLIATVAVTVALLAHGAGRLRIPSAGLIAPWIVLVWIIPPVIDGIVSVLRMNGEGFPSALSAASPPFALGMIWSDDLAGARVGLFTQVLLIPLLAVIWAVLKRQRVWRDRIAPPSDGTTSEIPDPLPL